MQISVSPLLGKTHAITVKSHPLITDAVPLQFTAIISNVNDCHKLVADGARLQLWSNLPQRNLTRGDWGELDFTSSSNSTKGESSLNGVTTVSLLSSDIEPDDASQIGVYSLVLRFPLSLRDRENRRSESVYSFTYRLLYPDGRIEWLGQFGHDNDGTIVFDESALLDPPFILSEGWLPLEAAGGGFFELHGDPSSKENVEVIKISNFSDYCVWAIGEDGILSSPQSSSLLFLVPRFQTNSFTLSQSYIVSASPAVLIELSGNGIITATGSGSLMLRIHDACSDMNTLTDSIVSHMSNNLCYLFPCEATTGNAILALTKMKHPVSALILPSQTNFLIQSPQVQIPLNRLLSTLETDATHVAVFSPLHREVRFVQYEVNDCWVNLVMDPWGSQFVLSQVHHLTFKDHEGQDPDDQWVVSMLSSHKLAASSEHLPTPPPSPYLQPLNHRLISSIASSDTAISSVPSLPPDVGIALNEPVPKITESNSSVLVVQKPPLLPQMGALTLLKHLFVAFGAFLRFLYHLLRKSDESDDDTDTVHHPFSNQDPQVVGANSLMPNPIPAFSEPPSLPEQYSDTKILEPPKLELSTPSEICAKLSVSGAFIIAVHNQSTSSSTLEDIATIVELNGQVPETVVKKCRADLGEVYLLEFDGERGAQIKISPRRFGAK